MTPALTANGYIIDRGAASFGLLRDSTACAGDGPTLRERLAEDGYVFLRKLLDVVAVRRVQDLIGAELSRRGLLEEATDRRTNVFPACAGVDLYEVIIGLDDLELRALTHHPALLSVFARIFGEDARPFDYCCPRIAAPGICEFPHADWVYMCRGTPNLLTAWIPLMDVPLVRGPLMILEGSHRDSVLTRDYLRMDADRLGIFDGLRVKHGRLVRGGRYSRRPDKTREEFGTRWLSANYEMGDVIIFSTRGLHATLDNRTAGFRASVDVRFQPASEPMDPRFCGPNPVAHAHRDRSILDVYPRLKRTLARFRAATRARKLGDARLRLLS